MIKLAPPIIIKVDTVEEFANVIIEKSFPYGLYRVWEEQIYTYGAWGNDEYVRIDGNKKKEILQQLKTARRRSYF